jgi:hypothetical protein
MTWRVICMNIPKKGHRNNWLEGNGSRSQAHKTTGCEGEIYDLFLAKIERVLNALIRLVSLDSNSHLLLVEGLPAFSPIRGQIFKNGEMCPSSCSCQAFLHTFMLQERAFCGGQSRYFTNLLCR